MNIATGKLDAPVEKQASILDAVTEAGTALAKFRGAGGEAIPYALSAGMGAGAQQATNRMLRSKLINSPKLLKALELGSATALGGGAGLAGALTAPLSKTLTHSGAGSAARQIGELTAMGAGAELALSPAVSGLLGAPVGATETLGKMFGGGALAFGGQVAKDRRLLSLIRNHYAMGGKLPRGVDPRVLGLTTRQNITQRFNSLGIPQGGLLGASGLGLMASGNPYLGAAAMLAAPLKNETTSKYMGDLLRELRAGAKKAKVDQKTKDTIDGLYKKSSYSIKLAAPVYTTHYCLDAPTMDKVALSLGFVGDALKGVGKWLGGTGAGKATTEAYGATRNFLGEGAGKLYEGVRGSRMFSGTTRQANKGRKQVMEMVNTQAPNMQNPAQVGESALLHEMGGGAAQGNVLKPIEAPVAANKPKSFSEAFGQGRQARQAQRQQQYATTEEGYKAYVDLGAKPKPGAAPNKAQEAAGRLDASANVRAQAEAALQPATPVPTRTPTSFSASANTQLSESVLNRLQTPRTNAEMQTLFSDLKSRFASLSSEEREMYNILRGYTNRKGQITKGNFNNLRTKLTDSRNSLNAFNRQASQRAAEQSAVSASPLTAPVQVGERATATPNLAASAPSQTLEAASAAQRDIPVVGGKVQGAFQYRPGGNPRGTFTSADQGLEIANIRFADSQLGKDLITIEGRGGVGKSSTLFQQGDIVQAQTQAAKKAQLHTKAATSTKATNALNAEIQQGLTLNPAASADLEASLTELAKQSGEVTPDRVIQAVNSRLAARGGGIPAALTPAEEATIQAAFNGRSGKAFSAAQRDLDGAMNLYNTNLKKGLETQLNKAETRLSDNLAKRVDKMSKETTGPMGFGQARRNATEIKDLEEVRALVETRSRIMKESGTIADRTQAAEMMRITEEALRSGSAEEIRALKQALANPGEAISSSGAASGLNRLLDTPARQQAFNLTNEQVSKFRDVVKMEGRGAGDQVKATREIFSTQAARSPNTPRGRELSQVVNDAAGAGNEAQAEAFLALGRQEGAGGSAFGKLTSGNKAGYSSEGYTVAELEAMGATPIMPTGLSGDAAIKFDQYILRGRGTLSDNIAAIDKQIEQAEKSLRGAKNTAATRPINRELKALRDARAEAQNLINTQNTTLAGTFSLAHRAEQGAANLVKSDMRMSNITLLNDAAKVQPPRNMNLDATRSALEAAASSDPAQHSKMVEGVFAQLKKSNPSMADEAIAQRMVNDGLISAEQLATMGGAQAFASGTAQQAGGGAMAGIAAVTAAGLGTAALAGRKPGVATQAKQTAKQQVRASWGISPLHAPVIRSKLASPIKPIPLKATQSKLPDMLKAPTQSPTTATAESKQSLLMAPVGGM